MQENTPRNSYYYVDNKEKCCIFGTFTKLRKATISLVMSVCPFAWINSAPTA